MTEVENWALIGPGSIGTELRRQLNKPDVAERVGLSQLPRFIVRSAGRFGSDGERPTGYQGLEGLEELGSLPDVTFVALPSTDDGEVAHRYISQILDKGKLVVTAEKGALANFFNDLEERSDGFDRLGINAAVGGGTKMMTVAQEYCRDLDNVSQIHLVVNGTLQAIFSSVGPLKGGGMPLGQAVQQAVDLGYAEPGSEAPKDVIRSEANGDIPKKTAIFFNALRLSERTLDWRELNFSLNDDQIDQAVEEAKVRRFIVSLYPLNGQAQPEQQDRIHCVDQVYDGWRIVAGFRHVDRNPLFSPLAELTGPRNGFVIGLGPDESDGIYTLFGDGAGPRPTVNTMIDDYSAIK